MGRPPVRAAFLLTALSAGSAALAEPPPADQARGLEEADGIEPADAALLGPRVLLGFPRIAFRVATWPLVGAIRVESRYHVTAWLEDLFYNDARTAAILPVLSFETFTGSSLGVVAFHRDLLGHGERVEARAVYGGRDRHTLELGAGAGAATRVAARVRVESAPDVRYYGQGAGGPEARYAEDRLLAVLEAGRRVGPVTLVTAALYNRRRFGGGSIMDLYDPAALTGFSGGVETLELRAGAQVAGRGLRAEAFAGGVPAGARYAHLGAEVAGDLELWAPGRRLFLRAAAEAVTGGEAPFTDLARLGGANRLRGYPEGRFRGRTAMLGTVEYRYPVHQILAGAVFVDAGRVSEGAWHAGGGLGLVLLGRNGPLLSADVAYGQGLSVVLTTDPLRAFTRKETSL